MNRAALRRGQGTVSVAQAEAIADDVRRALVEVLRPSLPARASWRFFGDGARRGGMPVDHVVAASGSKAA
ncbi:MAG TPA: hypothetical protein VMK12_06185 [Anaeromyxobacteraceae bacterium]|nr:hypothetical protein [Anaeromyxobacteraceae bacterium]